MRDANRSDERYYSDGSARDASNPSEILFREHKNADRVPKFSHTLVASALFFLMAFGTAAAGAPVGFPVLLIILGIALLVAYPFGKQKVLDLHEEKLRAYEEAQELLREEVAQTVRETLKGRVKVRCKY